MPVGWPSTPAPQDRLKGGRPKRDRRRNRAARSARRRNR